MLNANYFMYKYYKTMIDGIELLLTIASHDDIIKFCRTDLSLAKRFIEHFPEGRSESCTFDPIISAASNFEWLHTLSVWSKKGTLCRRGIHTFDSELYTKAFIKARLNWLDDPEKHKEPLRSGFDSYSHLMSYENDIINIYNDVELPQLTKAALHKIETKSETVELDYIKYIASFDDIIKSALATKPSDKSWEEFLPEMGKLHYESCGKEEILSGKRKLTPFFSAEKYVASYSDAIKHLLTEDGNIDTSKVATIFITFGFSSGLKRSCFEPFKVLAENPSMFEEDIFTNKAVDTVKVAKNWISRVKSGKNNELQFNPVSYLQENELSDDVDAFKSFVDTKVAERLRILKKQSSIFWRLGIRKPSCLKPKKKEPEVTTTTESQ